DSSYPSSPIIVYKEKKNNVIQRSFYYEIIEEAYISTSKERQYKIPDQYTVKTTIEQNKKKTIYCSINYENKQPVFHISYGENFEYKISSTSSSSAANNNALELLKSASQNCYSNENYISIKAIDYSINNYNFHIDFEKENLLQTKQYQLAIVQALDKTQGAISNEHILLNKQMEANIKITQVNLYHLEVKKDSTDVFEQRIIDKINKIGAQYTDWRITKTIKQLILNWNNINEHIRAPLFDMIPLENWICNELHVLLRIYDRLWKLIIVELKACGLYNDKSRKIIVDKIKRINVTFQFWKNHETHNWNYTSLMGKDKLKVLQSFNFGVLFRSSHAKLIC
ncbi:19369_t:CDS:2, partial [Gigaspora margarita]